MIKQEINFNVLHLYSGIGGMALGSQQAYTEYRGIKGKFTTLAGIDYDSESCQDFERITGAPAVKMDLFSRDDYIAFHGHEPPSGWEEVVPDDIKKATGNIYPDVIMLSPPCKGFSGLLPSKSAKSEKYQALNRLTVRGLWLSLEAFSDDLPGIILLENVPRIKNRGQSLLEQIKALLTAYGYLYHEDSHDCGEIGGLGQNRKRYLLIARQPDKVKNPVYQPPKYRVKSIGEVLSKIPLPDNKHSGPMHRLPRLQWKTWVRLALIPPGGDWRDLEKINPAQYKLEYTPRSGAFKVGNWNEPAGTIIGSASVRGSNGMGAVSDPRLPERQNRHPGVYRITRFDETSVTGTPDIQSGAQSIADPRTGFKERTHHVIYKISKWDEPSKTVTGAMRPNNGAISIPDPRLGCRCRNGLYGVQDWNQPGYTVTGARNLHSGTASVADPRIPDDKEQGVWIIIAEDGTWHRPSTTLELAALQGFPVTFKDGSPLVLSGNSDARWRERIGNAVPPPAAAAMSQQILRSLVLSACDGWELSATPIWVIPGQKEKEISEAVK